MNAFDELIDVIATGPAAERIVQYRASAENQQRATDLLDRQKNGSLSPDERAELDRYLHLEHLLRLAKARAHLYLQQQSALDGSR